jgi:chitin synthase
MMIFHGLTYDLDSFQHVGAPGIAAGDNPLYSTFNAGGQDGSFLFQRVNQHCKGIITPTTGTGIPVDNDGNLGWYFPCNLYNQFGTSTVNKTVSFFAFCAHLIIMAPRSPCNSSAD